MAKKRTSKRPRTKAKPLSFFQQISNFFSNLFTAPTRTAASRRKSKLVREIKGHGYSASYEKRLLRAVESGKARTLQAARGHRPGEAAARREREIKQQGLSSAQINSIRNFHARFDPRGAKREPDVNLMIEFAQKKGYPAFVEYREKWNNVRRNYERQQRQGTYESVGEDVFDDLEFDDLEDFAGDDFNVWFYYH